MRIKVFLVLVMLALIAGTAFRGVVAGADHEVSPDEKSWRADFNTKVSERNHWRWTLRRVERTGDQLTVSLRYRNSASTGRPVLLEDRYMETIGLIDDETGIQFALLEVDGVSDQITAVDRRSSKTAVFTFVYPDGASTVRFTSRWISMRMGGEASVMKVDFPIELPPANAKPK